MCNSKARMLWHILKCRNTFDVQRACNFLKALDRANKFTIKNNQSHPSISVGARHHLASAIDPLSTRIYTSVNKNARARSRRCKNALANRCAWDREDLRALCLWCVCISSSRSRPRSSLATLFSDAPARSPCDQTLTRAQPVNLRRWHRWIIKRGSNKDVGLTAAHSPVACVQRRSNW